MPVKAMDEILQQLVPLLIDSIPTILIFLTLVLSYKFLLHDPLREDAGGAQVENRGRR